jgi:hypothetical protein
LSTLQMIEKVCLQVAFRMGKFNFSHHGQVKLLTIDIFIIIFNGRDGRSATCCSLFGRWVLKKKSSLRRYILFIYVCYLNYKLLESSCCGFNWVIFYQNSLGFV